jgi:hypothetical protein
MGPAQVPALPLFPAPWALDARGPAAAIAVPFQLEDHDVHTFVPIASVLASLAGGF